MNTKKLLFIILLLIIAVILTHNYNEKNNYLHSETNIYEKEYIVGVDEMVPDVIISKDCYESPDYSGFDIELWEAIAEDIGIRFKYERYEFSDILKKLKNKEIDIGVAGFTIKEDREKFLDFSHHYLDSGLRIVIPKNNTILLSALLSIFTPSTLKILMYLLYVVIYYGLQREVKMQ
jgi:ABC-type amino acid transport substrate-binding protein